MARTDHGLPVVYNATAFTLSDGEGSAMAADSNGNGKVSLATTIAGEDLPNDVLKVEERYNYTNITLAAPTTTTVKSGVGFLHLITVGTPANTGTIQLYDNTAGSGTTIGLITSIASAPYTLIYDCSFTVGLTIVTSTAAQDITVAYR